MENTHCRIEDSRLVIFQTRVDDYPSQHTTITTLTADGTLSTELISRKPGDNFVSEVLPSQQILPEDTAEFERLLYQRRFSNFNQMSDSNEDKGLALHGNLTLIAPGTSVDVKAGGEVLPAGLQIILEAWHNLAY